MAGADILPAAVIDQETRYNWAAMFTAYASGSSLDDIVDAFAVPMPLLKRVASVQDWAAIASRLTTPVPTAAPLTEGRMAVLEANRDKNFRMADSLRDTLMQQFGALREGRLKIDRAMVTKGQVIHTEVEPGPQDLVALANAARSVADMTYRALGDVSVEERTSKTPAPDAASITVILPSVVVHQNGPKDIPMATVIDLRPAEPKQKTMPKVSETALDSGTAPASHPTP